MIRLIASSGTRDTTNSWLSFGLRDDSACPGADSADGGMILYTPLKAEIELPQFINWHSQHLSLIFTYPFSLTRQIRVEHVSVFMTCVSFHILFNYGPFISHASILVYPRKYLTCDLLGENPFVIC